MRNFLVFGFLLVILLTIPVTLLLVKNQTQTRSNASPATQLSFIPSTKTVAVGDSFQLDINLDPGQGASANSVAFVDLVITFPNSLQLQKSTDNNNTGIKLGQVGSTTIISLTDPKTTCATQTCTLKVSLGMPPNNTVKTQQPIATLYLTAVSPTDPNSNNGAEISFSGSKALSIANGDKASDNILAGAQSAFITITGQTTPTPTDAGSGGGTTPGVSPTDSGGGGGNQGSAPVCSSLSADTTSAATAPATVNFTAAGNSGSSTISKITFNFGDGTVQDVTSDGGIGTNAVNVVLAHQYTTTGSFTASATLTDATGSTSTPSSCTQTISIGQQAGSGGSSGGTTPVADTPVPTAGSIPSTGPGETIMAVGAVGAAVIIIGGLFLFGL
jgi:hypothetical protein